eukprot:g6380.t1
MSKIALQNQENDIREALADLKAQIRRLDGSTAALRQANQLVSRTRNLLEALGLDLRSCRDETTKAGYEKLLADFRQELRKSQTELDFRRKELQRSRQSKKHQSDQNALFGNYDRNGDQRNIDDIEAQFEGGGQSGPGGQMQTQKQQRAIQLGDQLQDKTEQSLKRILRMANEAETVGAKSLQTMHEHEERIGRLSEDMDEVHATLARTKVVVAGLLRGAASDKCVQMLCAIITLAILIDRGDRW